jgi:hypothetical protein
MAKAHGMSLNVEILQRLQASIDANGQAAAARPILDELRHIIEHAKRGR